MAQTTRVQDGIITYSATDPSIAMQFNVLGALNVGNDNTQDGVISTPLGIDLLVTTGSNATLSLMAAPNGNLLLNGIAWPNNAPTEGMYLSVSANNTLQFSSLPQVMITSVDYGLTITTRTSDYILQLSDAYQTLIQMDSPSAVVVTIPSDANVNLPIGANILIGWAGNGPVSIGYDNGVTVDTPETYSLRKQHAKIGLIKIAPNHWSIEGNLAAI